MQLLIVHHLHNLLAVQEKVSSSLLPAFLVTAAANLFCVK